MDFIELFTPKVLAMRWQDQLSNRIPYLGEGLFPARKRAGLEMSWIRGSKGLPISLMPSAFDAKATFRDRIGVSKLETEMPFFREGFAIKEKDRQKLLTVQNADEPYAMAIIQGIYDDSNQLIEGAMVAAERMRMQLLFPENGNLGIAVKANGLDYTYDFDQAVAGVRTWKASNYAQLTGTSVWSDHDHADPFANYEAAKKAIQEKTGATLAYAVMNSVTYNHMIQAEAIKQRFITRNGLALGYLTPDEAEAVIRKTTHIGTVIYDKQFKDESGNVHKFVPDGYVTLIPASALGVTNYGTTPEEADLIGGREAEVSIVNTGVALTRIIEPHPVNVFILASEIVLPSFEQMDSVYAMKVM